jgi:hypothetical protein
MADLQRLFDLADPRIRKVWDEKDTQLSKKLEYGMLGLTDQTAEIQDTKIENFTGLGYAQLTGENEAYNREDIAAGYSVTLTPKKYTKAITITEEMLRFNLWPKMNNLVGGVANSLNATIDQQAAKLYYLGHGTTFLTGGDGKALFATDHPMGDGTTQSNVITSSTAVANVKLSYDNLKSACQQLDRMYDDKGIQLLPSMKLRLIIPRELKERADEITRSIGNPDNANRISNFFANGRAFDTQVASWIPAGYSNYWFFIDMERASYMSHMIWGWRPKFDDDKIVNNGTKVYTGSTSFTPGFSSFQFAVGSTGAN